MTRSRLTFQEYEAHMLARSRRWRIAVWALAGGFWLVVYLVLR